MKKNVFVVFMMVALLFSCQEEALVTMPTPNNVTRAIVPETFDWDTADFMPTPPSQSIPVPWIGQGSIAMYYGLDVVNDHKHKDGWELMYSSFRSSGPALNDPYFILYNKYRGLLQLYVYITNPTVIASDNVLAEIRMLGSHKTTLFNFLGTTVVDVDDRYDSYDQLLPSAGMYGAQFAPNKWYMVQYELAYDPDMACHYYKDVHLDFNLQFIKTEKISLNGKQTGQIDGIIGGKGGGIVSRLNALGASGVQAAVGLIGKEAAGKLTIDSQTGENKIGISKTIWKGILSGVASAATGGTSNLLKDAAGVLSAIVFGGSNSSQTVSLNFDTDIKMTGELVSKGSFPSMPIDLWMPGTDISPDAQQYVPLYDEPLGVFYLTKRPEITIVHHEEIYEGIDDTRFEPTWAMQRYIEEYVSDNTDFRNLVEINQTVMNVADVDIDYDFFFKERNGKIYEPVSFSAYDTTISGDTPYGDVPDYDVIIRYRIKVIPDDKSINPSLIVKTFKVEKNMKNIIKRHSM